MIYIFIIVGIISSFFALRFFLLTHNKSAERIGRNYSKPSGKQHPA